MEYVKKVEKDLDKFALSQPEFVKVCEKYGLPPGKVLGGIFGVVVLLGIVIQGYNIICALLTCVYPMIQSIKTIERKNSDDTTKWLSFWTVFGIFQTLELFIGFILNFIPYYSIVRIGFFVYLMAPQTNGAQTLYKSIFQPFLKKHEKEIEAFVEQVQTKATSAGTEFVSQAKDIASTENLVKAAATAQEFTKETDP